MKKIIFIALIAVNSSFVVASCNNSSSSNKVSSTITDSSEAYTCTMHNEVISDHPGECPKCGMTLVKQKLTAEQKKMLQEGNYVKPKD